MDAPLVPLPMARLSGGKRRSGRCGVEPVTAIGSREQVTKILQRRVCDMVGVDPRTVRRERPPDHADIREKMHEIAGARRRFGYRQIGTMLEREGFTMNEKKLYRLYKEEGLSVPRRRGRKRARGTRAPMPIRYRPNVRWSLDVTLENPCAVVADPASSGRGVML